MTTGLQQTFALSNDEVFALADRIGAREVPCTLGLRSVHPTVDERDQAMVRAIRSLQSRGVVEDGEVDPDLVWMLAAVQRPDRRLAIRTVTPDGNGYSCIIRAGRLGVLVRRLGGGITLDAVEGITEISCVTANVVTELPTGRPAEIDPIGAPIGELCDALSGTRGALEIADRVRPLGATSHAAMLVGAALATREAFAEIVYHALGDGGERLSRVGAAVAVYYTRRGRIVGIPGQSPVGELWSTMTAGSDRAIAHAIGNLVELSDERWWPTTTNA